jgi:hypothetical protein
MAAGPIIKCPKARSSVRRIQVRDGVKHSVPDPLIEPTLHQVPPLKLIASMYTDRLTVQMTSESNDTQSPN